MLGLTNILAIFYGLMLEYQHKPRLAFIVNILMLFITLDICPLLFDPIIVLKHQLWQKHILQLCLGETDEQEEMTEEQAQEEFRRCYYYGISTLNQRIEA